MDGTQHVSIGTIREKRSWTDDPKRQHFVVVGLFKDAKEFRKAAGEALDRDIYDLRTIKWCEFIQVPAGKTFVHPLEIDS